MNASKRTARIAGFLYLLVAITGFFPDIFMRARIYVPGDASATADHILASEGLFRLSFLSILLMTVCWVLLAHALYVLFKPTDRYSSLLMVSFVWIGSAVTCLNAVIQFASLYVLSGADYLRVFETDQLQALAMLFIDLSEHGSHAAYLFFGLWLIPLSYLIMKSGLLPKIIGILLILAGLGYLIDFSTFFLAPRFDVSFTPYTFWGELFLLPWLMIKGVRDINRKGLTPS